jgi:hypothetical protein
VGVAWQDAVRKQLSSLIREAWLDYQSNPNLREAWAISARASSQPTNGSAQTSPQIEDDFGQELWWDITFLLNAFGYFHNEVAPLSWTPDLLNFGSPQWQESTHPIQRNFASR